MSHKLRIEYRCMKWIAARLLMGAWTCVSNLLSCRVAVRVGIPGDRSSHRLRSEAGCFVDAEIERLILHFPAALRIRVAFLAETVKLVA
jgi:hypothetical protein